MVLPLTELVCVVTDGALTMTSIEKCLVETKNDELCSKIHNSAVWYTAKSCVTK